MRGIFGEKLPIVNESNSTIKIFYNVFQYPKNIVFIRQCYRDIWRYLEIVIQLNYIEKINKNLRRLKKIPKEEKEINEMNDNRTIVGNNERLLNEFSELNIRYNKKLKGVPKSCLLRGNPGLGKTSFIIYLLKQLQEFKKN